jgi:uncharacterized protein YfaQ (DUF2300 family)
MRSIKVPISNITVWFELVSTQKEPAFRKHYELMWSLGHHPKQTQGLESMVVVLLLKTQKSDSASLQSSLRANSPTVEVGRSGTQEGLTSSPQLDFYPEVR